MRLKAVQDLPPASAKMTFFIEFVAVAEYSGISLLVFRSNGPYLRRTLGPGLGGYIVTPL
jgi:hypothetical protein